VFNCLINP